MSLQGLNPKTLSISHGGAEAPPFSAVHDMTRNFVTED